MKTVGLPVALGFTRLCGPRIAWHLGCRIASSPLFMRPSSVIHIPTKVGRCRVALVTPGFRYGQNVESMTYGRVPSATGCSSAIERLYRDWANAMWKSAARPRQIPRDPAPARPIP